MTDGKYFYHLYCLFGPKVGILTLRGSVPSFEAFCDQKALSHSRIPKTTKIQLWDSNIK